MASPDFTFLENLCFLGVPPKKPVLVRVTEGISFLRLQHQQVMGCRCWERSPATELYIASIIAGNLPRKTENSPNLRLQNLNPIRLFHRALLAFMISIIANINRWHLSHPHYVPGSAISMYFSRLHEPRAHPPPIRSALKSAKPPSTVSDSIYPPSLGYPTPAAHPLEPRKTHPS